MRRIYLALSIVLILGLPVSSWAAIAAVSGQVCEAAQGASGNTLVCVLPSNPTTGNTICVAFGYYNGGSGGEIRANVSAQDGNANAYTITPNSPSTYDAGAGQMFLAYLVNAPANANKTITVTINNANWASAHLGYVWAKEFTPTGGTMAFDADLAGTGVGSAINTPVVPVNGTGEMVFAASADNNAISSADSPFTGVGTIPSIYGWAAEYVLGRSAATAVAYTSPTGLDNWTGMGMSFSFTAGGGPNVTPFYRRRLQ